MDETKKLSLRQVFHKQGNLHQLVMLTVGLISKYLKKILKEEDIPTKIKAILEESSSELDKAELTTFQADKLRKKIKDIVYQRMNPDEIEVDIKE